MVRHRLGAALHVDAFEVGVAELALVELGLDALPVRLDALVPLVEKRPMVAVRNCHYSRLRNRDQISATKGPSTWAPGGRRGGGPLVAVLLANRD